ncbi:MAG: type II glyceraldehyde-3-phosphate dehydrogenase [Lentisphaerae bacterium]|nr:type II glyceraldehyde-3-phosphate dehydrogenase [Lentisphaerota bacterium]
MSKVKVGVVGFGTIGERIADGLAAQEDMELVGVCDVAVSLPVKALIVSGKGYPLYCGTPDKVKDLEAGGATVAGTLDDLLKQVDMVCDATAPGVGAKLKEQYEAHGVKATFQGGEKIGTGDLQFHSLANYDKAYGKDYLHILSCNTTGMARCINSIDRAIGVERVNAMIIRRAADVAETHKGPVDAAIVQKVPSHQCEDIMAVSPHIKALSVVVTLPITHGHVQTLQVHCKQDTSKEQILEIFGQNPRLQIFRIEDGFLSNSHIFDYCRDLGLPRADMYECPVWDEMIHVEGREVWFTQMIPQESIVIPENVDGVRAAMKMQDDYADAIAETNKYLKMGGKV